MEGRGEKGAFWGAGALSRASSHLTYNHNLQLNSLNGHDICDRGIVVLRVTLKFPAKEPFRPTRDCNSPEKWGCANRLKGVCS
jgi:hypothetical protein